MQVRSKNCLLGNHLANVLTVVSDRKIPVDVGNNGTVDYYVADILSANDYYAFGGQMSGRSYNGRNYRYGFNGKENDNEVKGNGNQQDYGMRIYDPRLGKFLSVDPLSRNFPWNSSYAFAENDVIRAIDLDGGEKNIQIQEVGKDGSLTVLKTIPYSKLYPGKEHGPNGTGTLVFKGDPNKRTFEVNYVPSVGDRFRKLSNYITGNDGPNSGETFTQRGGLNLYAKEFGGVGTDAKAKFWRSVLSVDIDLFLAYVSTGLKEPLKGNIGEGKNGTGTQAGALGDFGGAGQEIKSVVDENKEDIPKEKDSVEVTIKSADGNRDSLKYKAKNGEQNAAYSYKSKRGSVKKESKPDEKK